MASVPIGFADAPDSTSGRAVAGQVVSVGRSAARTAGAELARATGRPHQHVADAGVVPGLSAAAELTAVVALAADLRELDADAVTHLGVGVLAAADTEGLRALVGRTAALADDRPRNAVVPPGRRRRLTVIHPSLPGSRDADAICWDELAEELADPPGLLSISSHGRPCAVNFADGVICGRRPQPPGAGPAPTTTRLTSVTSMGTAPCRCGEPCFRVDLTDEQRIPARSIDAELVVLDTCFGFTAAGSPYAPDTDVSLELVQGTVLAVVGGLGRHVVCADCRAQLLALIQDGRALGECVRVVNAAAVANHGGFGLFGLLGDPALAWREGRLQLLAPTSPDVTATDPLHVAPPPTRIAAAETPSLRSMLLVAGHDEVAPAATADELVDLLAAAVHNTWWGALSELLGSAAPSLGALLACPACGSPAGRRHRYQLGGGIVDVLACGRCGPVEITLGPGASTLNVPGQPPRGLWCARGERLRVTAEVSGVVPGRSIRVGAAFVAGGRQGLPAPILTTVRAGVSGTASAVLTFAPTADEVVADVHELVVVTVLDENRLAQATRSVTVAGHARGHPRPDSPHESSHAMATAR